MGRNSKHSNCKVLDIILDNKGGQKPVWKTEVPDKNNKFLSLLKNIPGSDDVNAEFIREYMANGE